MLPYPRLSAAAAAAAAAVVLLTAIPVPLRASAPERPDPATGFAALSDDDKAKFVLAVLDDRDRQLANFSYSVRERNRNVSTATQASRFMYRDDYVMRRLGDTIWMKLTSYEYYSPDKVSAVSVVSWDGKQCRGDGLPPYLGTPYHQCRIDPKENSNFAFRRFNALLGIRMGGTAGAVSLADWLRRSLGDARSTFTAAPEAGPGGGERLRFTVKRGYEQWDTWLDPARGYMVARVAYRYAVNQVYNKSEGEVLAAEQVAAGVWVPRKARWRDGTSAVPAEESERAYEADEFTVGNVRRPDVEVEFPLGSRVIDACQGIAYFVEADNKYRLLKLADSANLTVRVPPANAVVGRVDESASKAYRTEKFVPRPPVSRTRLRAWSPGRQAALVASAVALMALGALALRRRRGRSVP